MLQKLCILCSRNSDEITRLTKTVANHSNKSRRMMFLVTQLWIVTLDMLNLMAAKTLHIIALMFLSRKALRFTILVQWLPKDMGRSLANKSTIMQKGQQPNAQCKEVR